MERIVYDIRLMADGQDVSFIVEDGAITSVHLSKKRLTPEEIARIRSLTEDVAGLFYSDVKWE